MRDRSPAIYHPCPYSALPLLSIQLSDCSPIGHQPLVFGLVSLSFDILFTSVATCSRRAPALPSASLSDLSSLPTPPVVAASAAKECIVRFPGQNPLPGQEGGHRQALTVHCVCRQSGHGLLWHRRPSFPSCGARVMPVACRLLCFLVEAFEVAD